MVGFGDTRSSGLLALEAAGLDCVTNAWVGAQENEKWCRPMWLLSTGGAGNQVVGCCG